MRSTPMMDREDIEQRIWEERILEAVDVNDIRRLTSLVGDDERVPTEIAAEAIDRHASLEAIRCLVEHGGVDPTDTDLEGKSISARALEAGNQDRETFRVMLENGYDLDREFANTTMQTSLHALAGSEDASLIDACLQTRRDDGSQSGSDAVRQRKKGLVNVLKAAFERGDRVLADRLGRLDVVHLCGGDTERLDEIFVSPNTHRDATQAFFSAVTTKPDDVARSAGWQKFLDDLLSSIVSANMVNLSKESDSFRTFLDTYECARQCGATPYSLYSANKPDNPILISMNNGQVATLAFLRQQGHTLNHMADGGAKAMYKCISAGTPNKDTMFEELLQHGIEPEMALYQEAKRGPVRRDPDLSPEAVIDLIRGSPHGIDEEPVLRYLETRDAGAQLTAHQEEEGCDVGPGARPF